MDSVISFVRKIIPPTETNFYVPSTWVYNGAVVDLDFANGRYWSSPSLDVVSTDLVSCSRASIGYARTSSGTLTQFANNESRITDLGLLMEAARINVVLWNRDLTNAVWTPTNITAAKDQTGPDGVSNSASSITATAGNGTILQSITLALSDRFQSAWVKRITGSGTIDMTMDNGATWTAITVTPSWELLSIPTQTLADPIVGFRIVTSGDAIAVDFVQNENGVFISSPIPTTTTSATRAADTLMCIGNLDAVLSSLPRTSLFDFTKNSASAFGVSYVLADNTGPWIEMSADANAAFVSSVQNGVPLSKNMTTPAADTTLGVKSAVALSAGARSITGAGNAASSDANAGTGASGSIAFGSQGGVNFGFILLRRATFWNTKLTDATLQVLTAP